jgi:hypothetical protein
VSKYRLDFDAHESYNAEWCAETDISPLPERNSRERFPNKSFACTIASQQIRGSEGEMSSAWNDHVDPEGLYHPLATPPRSTQPRATTGGGGGPKQKRQKLSSSRTGSGCAAATTGVEAADCYVGKPVAKYFGPTLYFGTVGEQDQDEQGNQIWKVTYTDGDSEDFNKDEVKRGMEIAWHATRSGAAAGGGSSRATIATSPCGSSGQQHAAESSSGYRGQKVARIFSGKLFFGRIGARDEDEEGRKIWKVTYTDGDFEDFDEDEVKCGMQLAAPRKPSRFSKAARKLGFCEFFSGTGRLTEAYRANKFNAKSVDNNPESSATNILDIMDIDIEDGETLGETLGVNGSCPDSVHFSPPCTTMTVLASDHRTSNGDAISPKAFEHDKIYKQCISIIEYLVQLNPDLVVTIENPRGRLCHVDYFKAFLERLNRNYISIGSKRELKPVSINYCAFYEGAPKRKWNSQ